MKKLAIAVLVLVVVTSWSVALIMSVTTDNLGAEVVMVNSHVAKADSWSGQTVSALITSPSTKRPLAAALQKQLQTITKSDVLPQVLGAVTSSTDQLSQEEAVSLVKPGVVLIVNHIAGSLSVSDFDVDFQTFALKPRPDLTAHSIEPDDYLYGSGFIVNPDGYIASNAHVASPQLAYQSLEKDVLEHVVGLIYDKVNSMTQADYDAYDAYLTKLYGSGDAGATKFKDALTQRVNAYVEGNAQDKLKQDLVVVDKSLKGTVLTKGDEFSEVYKRGLVATLVSYDTHYETSGKDVAIVKIDEHNLPVLPLGNSDALTNGTKIFVWGYPYNAQISNNDMFDPTLTEGIVSAVKQTDNQKLFQLDNKISEGSSGGPLTDAHGNVVGLMTYKSGDAAVGDDFGLALPVELVKAELDKDNIKNDLGVYGTNFVTGLSYEHQNMCQKADGYFTSAQGTNDHFNVSDEVGPYIKSCQGLIAAGMSNDTSLDSVRLFYRDHRTEALIFAVLTSILAVLLGWFAITWLWRKRGQHVPAAPMTPVITPVAPLLGQ